MAVAVARTPARLFGREAVVVRLCDGLTAESSPPVYLVTGPAGIGRTSVLNAVVDQLDRTGVPTIAVRVPSSARVRDLDLVSRLADELVDRHPAGVQPAGGPARDSSPVVRKLAAAIRAHRGPLVIAIDDLQWADPASLTTLAALARTAGTSIKFIACYRLGLSGGSQERARALADPLTAAGVVEPVPLRPLRTAEVDLALTDLLAAKPTPAMSAELRAAGRGVPAVISAAVDGHRQSGALHLIDRHAYLSPPDTPLSVPAGHQVFEHLRELGSPTWPILKALAALHPLGDESPRLIAEAVDLPEEEVRRVLETLRGHQVLLLDRHRGGHRFRIPLMAPLLLSCLGPYERRELARVAVTALWDGSASCQDIHYLPEQLVAAGKLVDPERAGTELLAYGAEVKHERHVFAERSFRAASALIVEPGRRAFALLQHAGTCAYHQDLAPAAASIRTLFSEHADQFAPELLSQLQVVILLHLLISHDQTALHDFADHGWRALPGGEADRIVCRALALCFADRWDEADELLRYTRDTWMSDAYRTQEALVGDDRTVVNFGLVYGPIAAILRGRPRAFRQLVADQYELPLFKVPNYRLVLPPALARVEMMLGEADQAEQLFTAHLGPNEHRKVEDRALLASLRGRWDEALDLARLSLATSASANVLGHTLVCRAMATILIARGKLTRARVLIAKARTDRPVLPYLLTAAQAELESVLGAHEHARALVRDSLVRTAQKGLVAETDELWLWSARDAMATEDEAHARHCLAELEWIAGQMGTERTELRRLEGRAAVLDDRAAAAEAVRLARRRGHPFELATVLCAIGSAGPVDDKLLFEAYDVFGELDALLPRARLRHLLRSAGVPVPGRDSTVAENERLLASLVAEGLTNREIATVLRASEKSVEGRLSRLFQRTGYRSRVELATAMLTGEYRG